ncbi:hypothetical protein K438DRAFT_1792288 [Mycena galopus ATCC 62051]|nr:hypothetical protein K438DRAFT_1792288 [Mycena galopus ATCC 62051]
MPKQPRDHVRVHAPTANSQQCATRVECGSIHQLGLERIVGGRRWRAHCTRWHTVQTHTPVRTPAVLPRSALIMGPCALEFEVFVQAGSLNKYTSTHRQRARVRLMVALSSAARCSSHVEKCRDSTGSTRRADTETLRCDLLQTRAVFTRFGVAGSDSPLRAGNAALLDTHDSRTRHQEPLILQDQENCPCASGSYGSRSVGLQLVGIKAFFDAKYKVEVQALRLSTDSSDWEVEHAVRDYGHEALRLQFEVENENCEVWDEIC